MSSPVSADQQTVKNLMKASWAASAPAVVPFVILITVNSVDLLSLASLGRLGVTSILVIVLCLSYLFWRGRWWAGAPSLLMFIAAMAVFLLKFFRPLLAYLKANPDAGLGDLLMLSPALVVVLISLTLGIVTWRGIRICRQLAPRPVGRLFWGIAALWTALLIGDLWYQQSGWRYFNQPDDLVIRLCQNDKALRKEAAERLLKVGPRAVPTLLEGMAAPDPDLECLRDSSRQIVLALGKEATPQLVEAAKQGNLSALAVLGELGDTRAARLLWEIYRDPQRKSTPEFQKSLKNTIQKLDPSLPLSS